MTREERLYRVIGRTAWGEPIVREDATGEVMLSETAHAMGRGVAVIRTVYTCSPNAKGKFSGEKGRTIPNGAFGSAGRTDPTARWSVEPGFAGGWNGGAGVR